MRAELYERVPAVPKPVWAVQWRGDPESWKAILDLGATFKAPEAIFQMKDTDELALLLAGVEGAQGEVTVPVDHWVVKGGLNDFWPVDPVYFDQHYQRKFGAP